MLKGVWSVALWRGDVVEHRHYCDSEDEAVRYAEDLVKRVWFNAGLQRRSRRRWVNMRDGIVVEVMNEGELGNLL